jgi:hypothetical protein
MKKLRSFRVDEVILDALKKAGLDANRIVEAALAKAVKAKKCPYCGAPPAKK